MEAIHQMNGYIAFFRGKRIEIRSDTLYHAKLEAIRQFKPTKKQERAGGSYGRGSGPARMIYYKSTGKHISTARFFDGNEAALEDMRKCAEDAEAGKGKLGPTGM
jgi:hypothetical protein